MDMRLMRKLNQQVVVSVLARSTPTKLPSRQSPHLQAVCNFGREPKHFSDNASKAYCQDIRKCKNKEILSSV